MIRVEDFNDQQACVRGSTAEICKDFSVADLCGVIAIFTPGAGCGPTYNGCSTAHTNERDEYIVSGRVQQHRGECACVRQSACTFNHQVDICKKGTVECII